MKRGFTLIELLLYVGIVAIMIGVIAATLNSLLEARVKNQTRAEVEQQGAQVMELMLQTARNATAINSPAAGSSSATLSLKQASSAADPTVFDLASGALRITEGTSEPLAITNDQVTVSSLTIENLSPPSTHGTVRITLLLNHINPSNRTEYNISEKFYGSATLH
ncbi:type II secretion system protein [Candidatus Berkelbacteria bacterium]|nr:type II secretion system protein [Candidatus Berkelbacteria bacterium]